jgi:hypothetical protein
LKDSRYYFWNGQYALVNVILGKGSFKVGVDYTDTNDVFAFGSGSAKYWTVGPPIDWKQGATYLWQPSDNTDPVVSKEIPYEQLPIKLDEYAYGFWFRYLTHYPTRQWNGKGAGWYFVARLTANQNYGDTGVGDKLLLTYQ